MNNNQENNPQARQSSALSLEDDIVAHQLAENQCQRPVIPLSTPSVRKVGSKYWYTHRASSPRHVNVLNLPHFLRSSIFDLHVLTPIDPRIVVFRPVKSQDHVNKL